MRWKTLAIVVCLLIGAILVAWVLNRPHIPRGAREELNRVEHGPYSILSAQQVEVAGSGEAWCVEIETHYDLDIYCGPSEADNVDCPPSRYAGTYYYLLIRDGNYWGSIPKSSCPVK